MADMDWNTWGPWATTSGAGVLGRLMFHARQVQLGRRKPLTWALAWDLPIALGMGWIALGIATWLRMPQEVTVSIALVVAYLGPYAIDSLFMKWSEWKFGKESV